MSETHSPVRIALVDDQELFIESLDALLANARDEVEVIWTARSGEEALEKARMQPPEVVLMDYSFKGPALDGGDITQIMTTQFPGIGVLMLSVSCELTIIRETLQKGALGYASKEISKRELLHAIRTVARKEFFLDQPAMGEVIAFLTKKQSKSGPVPTPRELQVAQPYARGQQIRDIAAALFISEDTVESHIKNIRSKFGATSRYEVGEYLKKHGLWEE